ncbi:hypothetical protein BX667DRAFT_499889 [Coemansia mojavensis]|nr:hypothetical protein BX667DRAFT_499889 [Coemansia mojavensis]
MLNMPVLAQYVHKIAPNANMLRWQNVRNLNRTYFSIKMHKAASQMTHMFIRPELLQLYLADSLTESLLQISVMPTQLRSLCVQNTGTNDVGYELAIRNLETLEYLCILCTSMVSAKVLIYDASLPYSTRVYPQLCQLVIDSYAPTFISDIEQPQSNPFPKLKVLMCDGIFPFNAPKVLLNGLNRITHLKFMVDWTLYTTLENEHILNKDAFGSLYFLSTELRHTSQYEFGEDEGIKALIKTSVELSSFTRVLKLPRSSYSEPNGFLLSLEFPPYLRQLTLPLKPIDIDDLIVLLFKLDYLQQVTVNFQCCLWCSRTQEPSDENIRKYRHKFIEVNASVNTLNVNIIGSRFALKTAENIVLLADVLSNVLRVQFYSHPQTGEDTLCYIYKARLRTIYRDNKRLQQVKFTGSQTEIL